VAEQDALKSLKLFPCIYISWLLTEHIASFTFTTQGAESDTPLVKSDRYMYSTVKLASRQRSRENS